MALPPDTGVKVGDIHMHAYSGHPPDEQGVVWKLTVLDGWFDGWESGTGTGVQQRGGADGSWVSPQYAGPRVIHPKGTIEADSWDGVTRAWDRLLAEIPFRDLGPILVSTGEGTYPEQMALIRQEGPPLLQNRFDNRAEFSLSLLAPDPRKYAAVSQSLTLVLPMSSGGLAFPRTYPITFTETPSQSSATVVNEGTWNSPPMLTITGPCPPCRISNLSTAQSLRVVDAIPAGQSLVIDVHAGTATVGGQSRSVLGSWWELTPGPNTIAFTADGYDAAAQLLVSFRSAWK